MDANAEALEAEINGEVTSCSCDSCSNNESNDRGVSVYGKTSGIENGIVMLLFDPCVMISQMLDLIQKKLPIQNYLVRVR